MALFDYIPLLGKDQHPRYTWSREILALFLFVGSIAGIMVLFPGFIIEITMAVFVGALLLVAALTISESYNEAKSRYELEHGSTRYGEKEAK